MYLNSFKRHQFVDFLLFVKLKLEIYIGWCYRTLSVHQGPSQVPTSEDNALWFPFPLSTKSH